MDLVSHALAGTLVASVGLHQKYGPVASATLVAASLLPDVDGVLGVFGPRYFFQYHRHATHSVGGVAMLAAALAAAVCLTTPLKRPGLVFAISLGGLLLHLLTDLLTHWPIPFWLPFSTRTYSFDLIPVLDPFLLAALAVGALVAVSRPGWAPWAAVLALVLATSYLGFRATGQRAAGHAAQAAVAAQRAPAGVSTVDEVTRAGPIGTIGAVGGTATRVSVLPHGLSPAIWDVIVQEDGGYRAYVVDARRRTVLVSEVFPGASGLGGAAGAETDRADAAKAVALSRRSALVQAFLKRARFPTTVVASDGDRATVTWRDVHLLLGGGLVAGVQVTLDGHGEIVDQRFELRTREGMT